MIVGKDDGFGSNTEAIQEHANKMVRIGVEHGTDSPMFLGLHGQLMRWSGNRDSIAKLDERISNGIKRIKLETDLLIGEMRPI